MGKHATGKFLGLVFTLLVFCGLAKISAQTFTGTNSPGATTVFNFTTTGATTNLSLTVPGSAAGYSHLLLRNGAPPTDSAYNFISQLTSQTNSIHLELPELLAANYFAGVRTPSGSVTHNFTLLVDSNRNDLRSVTRPVTKFLESTNTGLLAASGAKHYFRFEVPTNVPAWKISLTSTSNAPDLFIRRDQVPSETTYLKRSLNQTNDTLSFVEAELTPGAYFVGVFSPAGAPTNVSYTLRTETLNPGNLVWDLGATAEGTSIYTNASGAGDFYFKIRTENPALAAWRTALKVTAGEADIYLSRGTLPSSVVFDFKSDKMGSDGFVLSSSQFNAGEDWYLMVRAGTGSEWTLVTGAPFVTDLGNVAADASSGSGDVVIGPEGMRFFQTTMPANTLAWRLWLNGATNSIYLKKTGVPLPQANELAQIGQMLVVPSYLTVGQIYFIGIAGIPGAVVSLDSRQQSVADISFDSTLSVATSGYGYSTYRVTVPPQQIAWQVNLIVASGTPNVTVRRNLVANESNNDAYSEVPGMVTDNITLVPPVLSDGTFYITVYNTNLPTTNCAFTLENGPPVVTDINYSTTITNDDTNRVGWRFYRVSDINQQLGSLGWDLLLTNFSAGTKIALRRNSAPGIWPARLNATASTANYYDFLSAAEFLQRPGHQADIWYVGVYNPTNVLGSFTLISRELTPEVLLGDGGVSTRSSVASGKWEFFRVDVPSDVLGWDVRLAGVTSGLPKIVVRRELLPTGLTTTLASPPPRPIGSAARNGPRRLTGQSEALQRTDRSLKMDAFSPWEWGGRCNPAFITLVSSTPRERTR